MSMTPDSSETFSSLLTELELADRPWLEQGELLSTETLLLRGVVTERYQVLLLDPSAETLIRRGFADRRDAEQDVSEAATARTGFVVAVLDLLAGRPMAIQVRTQLV